MSNAMKNGRFDNGLLEFTPGEQLARRIAPEVSGQRRGRGAGLPVSQGNDPMFVSYDTPEAPVPRGVTGPRAGPAAPSADDRRFRLPTSRSCTRPIFDQGAAATARGHCGPEVMIQFAGSTPTRSSECRPGCPPPRSICIDGPGLSDYVNGRLVEMLYIQDDGNCSMGPATVPSCSASSAKSACNPVLRVRRSASSEPGFAAVENLEAPPTPCVNPADAWAMFGCLPDWPQLPRRQLGVAQVRTNAMPGGRRWLVPFSRRPRCECVRRPPSESPRRPTTTSSPNRLKLLAELREALNVTSPDLFCENHAARPRLRQRRNHAKELAQKEKDRAAGTPG